MLNDELSILAAVPDGLGAGMFYWAPEWIRVSRGHPTPLGTPDDNQTLFNFQGQRCRRSASSRTRRRSAERANPDSAPCAVGG